jgi:hypothetical protein
MQQGMQGMPGMGSGAAPGGARPTKRNAVMTLLIPFGLSLGNILATALVMVTEVTALAVLGNLFSLAAFVIALLSIIKMTNELKSVTGNASLAWWPILVPFYNLYWACVVIPGEMAKAKQMWGVQRPPRGIIVYFFLFLYAFAADLNDLATAA